jgi:hypothetical protein
MEDVGHVVLEHQQFFHPNINIHPRNHGLGDLHVCGPNWGVGG